MVFSERLHRGQIGVLQENCEKLWNPRDPLLPPSPVQLLRTRPEARRSPSQSGLQPILVSTRWQLSCRYLGPWSDNDSGVHCVCVPDPPWSPVYLTRALCRSASQALCFCCCDKIWWKAFWKGRGLFGLYFQVSVYTEQNQGRNLRPEPGGRNWSTGHGGARLTGLFLMLLSYISQVHQGGYHPKRAGTSHINLQFRKKPP